VETVGEVKGQLGTIDLLDLHNLEHKEIVFGQVCEAYGKAAMEYIAKAAELAGTTKIFLYLCFLPQSFRKFNGSCRCPNGVDPSVSGILFGLCPFR